MSRTGLKVTNLRSKYAALQLILMRTNKELGWW